MNNSELEKLTEYYKNGRLAHAYLISTNNIQKCLGVLLDVIKSIFCDEEYHKECNKCSLCHLIDKNNYPCLKVIEPDGTFIKKNQILELRRSFSESSQFGDTNIYIIKNAEKMNKESANTMLKFLEEPNGNVIGFFITNNADIIMPTIRSRCQILNVIFDNEVYEKLNITRDKYDYYLSIVDDYLDNIENNGNKGILINNEIINELEKEDIIKIFQIMLELYRNDLENKGELTLLKGKSSKNKLKKVNLIIEILNELNYNVNVNLLLDKFVIEMEDINYEVI